MKIETCNLLSPAFIICKNIAASKLFGYIDGSKTTRIQLSNGICHIVGNACSSLACKKHQKQKINL